MPSDSCKSADTYQGLVKPRCNKGRPCQACKDKFVAHALERIMHNDMLDDPMSARRIAANALDVLRS